MRNRIVPFSPSTSNQQQYFPHIQQQQNVVEEIGNSPTQLQEGQKRVNMTSISKLNLFLEKMELENEQEDQQEKEEEKEDSKKPQNQEQASQRQIQQNPQQYAIKINREPSQNTQREQRLCKICLEDTNEPKNLLLTPCKCQGSIGYIHQECLKTWIVSQGYDLFQEIKCELCHEEYEMEIEVSSKCMPQRACEESKCFQIFSLSWLVIFAVGNIVSMIVMLYYQISQSYSLFKNYFIFLARMVYFIILLLEDSNNSTSWGYIIMALIILTLFEIALVLLIKHYGSELLYGLYVSNWCILDFKGNQNDMEDNHANQQQSDIERDKGDMTGGIASQNQRRSVNQVRVIQSRSVLSNYLHDNNQQQYQQQNNEKIPSRLNQSRNQSQSGIRKSQNYQLGQNQMQHINSNNKKSMTISQLKAHLGLDDLSSYNNEESKEKSVNQESRNQTINIQNNNFNQRSTSDQQLLDFIKNNGDLYSHVLKAYQQIDNKFILKENEISKDMTVEILVDRSEEENFLRQNNQIKRGSSIKNNRKVEIDDEEKKQDSQNNSSRNANNNYKQQNQQSNAQIKQQPSLGGRTHHLIDIFKNEEQSQQKKIQDQRTNIN